MESGVWCWSHSVMCYRTRVLERKPGENTADSATVSHSRLVKFGVVAYVQTRLMIFLWLSTEGFASLLFFYAVFPVAKSWCVSGAPGLSLSQLSTTAL